MNAKEEKLLHDAKRVRQVPRRAVWEWREKSELERRHYPALYVGSYLIQSLWDNVNKKRIVR